MSAPCFPKSPVITPDEELIQAHEACKRMNVSLIDASVLRENIQLGVDVVLAHEVADGHAVRADRMALIRDQLEARVRVALSQLDETELPFNWSWEQAAARLSFEIAMDISRGRHH